MSPAKRLDPETLIKLRLAVGVPPEGPTPALRKAWATEDRLLAGDDVDEANTVVDDVDALKAELHDLRAQLRSEHGRRGSLCSQLTKLRQQNEQLRTGQLQLAAPTASPHDQFDHAEVVQLRAKLDIVRRERDDLQIEVIRAENELRAERDRLAGLLEEASARIDEMQRQVEDVIATAKQLAAATADLRDHVHTYPWPTSPKGRPQPCVCGHSWPGYRPATVH